MAVRFKFRSSTAFEAVDLAGSAAISVGSLRAEIVRRAGLQSRGDFDLLISDAASGRTLEDEGHMLPAGSDVIVKRVPAGGAGAAPRDMVDATGGHFTAVENPQPLELQVQDTDSINFNDFGNDICPMPVGLLDLDADLADLGFSHDDMATVQCSSKLCSGMSNSRHHNVDPSDVSEAMSKEIVGENYFDEIAEEKETKINSKLEEDNKQDRGIMTLPPTMLNVDLPPELRCFLCKNIFKEAVMIPCCQHSFCGNCIRSYLTEKKRCPKCDSDKCNIDDLLPNLSLRQAIEHFRESQAGLVGFDDSIPKYAPDGESAIRAMEPSCALSNKKQETHGLCSPFSIAKQSNKAIADSPLDNRRNSGIKIRLDGDKYAKQATPMSVNVQEGQKITDIRAGGSSTMEPHNILQTRADGIESIGPAMKYRKADRTCYMCGSPSHLIRDCPVALNASSGDNPYQGYPYGPSNWQAPQFRQLQPYGNMYGAPGMFPFESGVMPMTPFATTCYVPSLYTGMTSPYPWMRMGGVPSAMLAGTPGFGHPEFMGHHGVANKQRIQSGNGDRSGDYQHENYESQRSLHQQKHQSNDEASEGYLDADRPRGGSKPRNDRHRTQVRGSSWDEDNDSKGDDKNAKKPYASESDRRHHYSEKSLSGVHNASAGSSRHGRPRSDHYETGASQQIEGRRKFESESKVHHQRSLRENAGHADIAEKHRHQHAHKENAVDASNEEKHRHKPSYNDKAYASDIAERHRHKQSHSERTVDRNNAGKHRHQVSNQKAVDVDVVEKHRSHKEKVVDADIDRHQPILKEKASDADRHRHKVGHNEKAVDADVAEKRRHEPSLKRKAVDADAAENHRHRHKHHEHQQTGLGPDNTGYHNKNEHKKESGHSSRHSSKKASLSADNLLENDRWEMMSGPDDDGKREYQNLKRKR